MMEREASKTWIYAGLLAAGAYGIVRLLSRGPLVKADSRVLLVGDSLSVGLKSCLKSLAGEDGVAFSHVGKEGTTICQWASESGYGAQLRSAVASFKPTLVLVSLGTNDEHIPVYNASYDMRTSIDCAAKLITQLVGSGIKVGWIGPPTNAHVSSTLRKSIASIVGEDYYHHSELLTIPRGPDQLHPTAKGYCGWASSIWRWAK